MSKKTSYSYIGIAAVILIFGIIFIPEIVKRVSNHDVVRDESRSGELRDNVDDSELLFLNINGKPKKVPHFSFVDQNGDTITDQDYLGKVYVAEFFFTTCPSICPKMNRNMVEIQNAFNDIKDFGIASFSINPDYDTVEVLRDYAEQYKISHPNWHLMTGSKDSIYNLANVGFNIYAGENPNIEGGFEHSGNFALIDKKGYIRSRSDQFGNPIIFYKGVISEKERYDDDGEREEISLLKQDIKKLLAEQ